MRNKKSLRKLELVINWDADGRLHYIPSKNIYALWCCNLNLLSQEFSLNLSVSTSSCVSSLPISLFFFLSNSPLWMYLTLSVRYLQNSSIGSAISRSKDSINMTPSSSRKSGNTDSASKSHRPGKEIWPIWEK